MDTETPSRLLQELCEKLPDFRRAYFEGSMAAVEFAEYGPVQHFRRPSSYGYERADRRDCCQARTVIESSFGETRDSFKGLDHVAILVEDTEEALKVPPRPMPASASVAR